MTRTLTLVVVFVLTCATSAAAQQVRVNHNRTPLRSEPTQSSVMLAYYPAGSALDIISVNDGWYRVRDPKTGQEGYILATLVDVLPGSKPATDERPAPPPTQPATKPIPPAPPPSKTTTPPTATSPRSPSPPGVQTKPAITVKPAVPAKPKLGVRGIVDVSAVWMTASESFKAVTDTSMRVQFGGGIQVVNIWKGLYAEGTFGWSELKGSRVFVYEDEVYDLGIPTTMTFIPIDVGGGWRFRHSRSVHSYVGGGIEFLKYQEESDFAGAEDNVDEVFTSYFATGGVEVRLAKWLYLRGEARYTSIPNALGTDGVSADFDETNLGGVAVAVKLAIGK